MVRLRIRTGCDDVDDDCDGSQLDALGVCSGDCAADSGCGQPAGCEGIPGDCDCDGNQLDALGVCGGGCESDLDGDGICDTDETGADAACNYNPDATDEDGSCLTNDALGVCSQNCSADLDGDSICATWTCVGATTTAASGLAPMTADVPTFPRATPRLRRQPTRRPRSLGVDCAADADADGLCDDVDFCVEFDECGVCNDPSTTAVAQASRLATATNGNQLDALGICGSCEP